MKLMICGAHPDDPETGCGGLAAKYSQAGHQVTLVYFSCGNPERQFEGRPHDIVREEECRRAAETLGATVGFLGFEDDNIEMTAQTTAQTAEYISEVQPDIVLTHWPVDTHHDHQATGNMVLQTYLAQQQWALYFYEVYSGKQTLCFNPTNYVDISEFAQIKRQACFYHESQDIESWYPHHEHMNQWRGYEAGVTAAEALVACPRPYGMAELPQLG